MDSQAVSVNVSPGDPESSDWQSASRWVRLVHVPADVAPLRHHLLACQPLDGVDQCIYAAADDL